MHGEAVHGPAENPVTRGAEPVDIWWTRSWTTADDRDADRLLWTSPSPRSRDHTACPHPGRTAEQPGRRPSTVSTAPKMTTKYLSKGNNNQPSGRVRCARPGRTKSVAMS